MLFFSSPIWKNQLPYRIYGYSALLDTTCTDWFHQFKDGKIDQGDKKRANRYRKVEDHKLQTLLDEDDQSKNRVAPKRKIKSLRLLWPVEPGETINAHCYHQQLIKLYRAMRDKR